MQCGRKKRRAAAAAKSDESSESDSEDVDSLAFCSDNEEQDMFDNMPNAAATSSETDSEFLGFEI